MDEPEHSAGLRSPHVRAGLRLLTTTALRHRRDSALSIFGALVWMATVVAVPAVVSRIIDQAIGEGRTDVLVPLVALLVFLGAVQALGIAARRYYGFRMSYRAEADLRNRMFEHIQRLAFSFHDQTSTGQLMARASSDLSQVRLILSMLPITTANVAMFVLVVIVMIVINPLLGIVAGLTLPLLYLTASRYARRTIGLSFGVQQAMANLAQVVEEAVGGIQVVKAYGQQAQEQRRLEDTAEEIYEKSFSIAKQSAIFSPLFEAIPAAGTAAVLWIGGLQVIDGTLSAGDFVAFTLYLAVLVLPIRITGWFFANLPRAAVAATRVADLLATDAQIDDPDDAVPLPPGPGTIEFAGVRFGYDDGRSILDGVDLVIPGGSSVALVGATGAGKTTLAHLIPRFHDVGGGAVTIDGVDVRTMSLDELRREVAVVFQETFLFSASVTENLSVGDRSASPDQVRGAARLAQAHDFICELPDAYDTVVGERGHTLSGGQRQRLALARAVLRDPRVLILDDATSSVDAKVESEIQSALRQVMRGRTTIIIAHRTSTLDLVDRVVFLEDGAVSAMGTHRDLLERVPRYGEVLARHDLGSAGPAMAER